MKKLIKISISWILVFMMTFTVVPMNVFATSTTEPMIIYVSSEKSAPGSSVKVDVGLRNNPGVSSLGLKVSYDESILTLDSVDFNSEFGGNTQPPSVLKSPVTLLWVLMSGSYTKDSVFATLTFTVSDKANNNAVANIDVSFDEDDIYQTKVCTDSNGKKNVIEENVSSITESGKVTVTSCLAGDITGDRKINNKDVSRLMQYLAGWNVTVNTPTLDVNADTKINNKDVSRLMQYLAGWNVEIFCACNSTEPTGCKHTLVKVDEKPATCEVDGNIAYWYCSSCKKLFGDANGMVEISENSVKTKTTEHKVVVDAYVAPTSTTEGKTEGKHCSICGYIIQNQDKIPVLDETKYNIIYNISNNDSYLQSIKIANTNPATYSSEKELKLANLKVDGYIFEGWYDGEGVNGELVKTIPVGTKGDIELYAKWSLKEYTITFDSPDVPVDNIKYTVDKGATLKNAKWYGYTFVGWSNDDGFLISKIKPGTTGNITLHANWTSNRNKATSYSVYKEPIIIEDNDNRQIIAVYDIGRIDNVPLSVIEYLGNSDGISIDREYSITNTITNESAENIANIVSNATTKTSGWTLSEDWNKVYVAGSEREELVGKSEVRTDSEGNIVGGNYFVSNSEGGASYISNSSGGSNSVSSKVTMDKSLGINSSYEKDKSTEKYADVKLGVKNETSVGAGVSLPVNILKVSAEVKNTTTLSAEANSGRRDVESEHFDGSMSSYVGTSKNDEASASSYFDVTTSNSSNWNTTQSYEKSYQQSRNTEISQAMNEQITNKTTYNVTDAVGGSNSQTLSVGGTDSRSEEYSSTVIYSKGDSTIKTQKISYKSNEAGFYRLINAGTVHVFGVVGYDIATKSYYTYSYSVLDDERHTYLDYAKDNALFNDCENGVVSFEVPFEVNEYVMSLTNKSDDLEISLNGLCTGYEGTQENSNVIVPQYYSANNGADGTSTAVKVTAISSNAFKGNTNVKKIVLPIYVTEIPDSAFEGCINLETIIALGVTKIGNNAFKGCTSLKTFMIDNYVAEMGVSVFENVPSVEAMVANTNVFDAVLNSGAKSISVNVSKIEGSLDNKTITVSNERSYFALLSNGKAYNNLQIESNATNTYLSNLTLINNNDTPLKINSSKVTLNRLNVNDAPGFALILNKDNADISLYSSVNLNSKSENAFICKNITLSKENREVTSELNTIGDVLVCGNVKNDSMLKVSDNGNNHYETITEEQFNRYTTSRLVIFNANGGQTNITNKTVYYGQKYGTLPIPTREHYNFDGWYTSSEGGDRITDANSVTTLVNQELFAHWTLNSFKVKFDANGGLVGTSELQAYCGKSLGTLPTPTRDYYNFEGWFTSADGGTKVTGVNTYSTAKDITLYAHWKEKSPSSWVLASNMPSGAKIVDEKYSYTLREYTESGSSSYSGWNQYDKRRTSWSATQGPVYSDPNNGVRNVWSESYETGRTHYYKYYRFANSSGSSGSYAESSTYWNYEEINLPYELTESGTSGGYKWWYNSSHYHTVWYVGEWDDVSYGSRWYYQDPVYTYYYYRDLSKESTSNPSGSNISNVQHWVKYIEK